MDTDQVWSTVRSERAALAERLSALDESAWDHPTLCDGWTVKDVAAHVIAHPQLGWRHLPGMLGRNVGRGYNGIILREVERWSSQRSREDVLAEFERYDGSRKHAPLTTCREALIDVLVHTQDILRPLGIHHPMPPEAAAEATARSLKQATLMGWHAARGRRLEATDVAWSAGSGPVVRGPAQELLMLVTGRTPDATLLEADG